MGFQHFLLWTHDIPVRTHCFSEDIIVTDVQSRRYCLLSASGGIYALYKVKLSKKLVKKAGLCYNVNVCKSTCTHTL